jgi:hypothetical protein
MPADSTPAVADLSLTDEVRDFCQRNDLLDHLRRAVELARQHFSIVGEPKVLLQQDPEDGEWYLDLEIRVLDGESEYLRAHEAYTRSWVNSAPWPAVHLITLFTDFVEQ